VAPNHSVRLEPLRHAALTYSAVGATAGAMPANVHQVRRSAPIGHGRVYFALASAALMSWQMHRRAGLTVTASEPQVAVDAVVLMRFGVAGYGLKVPCRVVYTVNEPRRIGFAYGTLPGHPESGEEAFVVELMADDEVRLHVTAFSAPARLYSRLGGRATRAMQSFMTGRYINALRNLEAPHTRSEGR
jgi:uncharacterized protein (UPF0548 family)